MRKTQIRLKLDSLEARETPDGSVGDVPQPPPTVPAMAPQEPVIIEPDYQIILPHG